MDLLARLLSRRPQRDGAAPALEAAATGLPASRLDAAAGPAIPPADPRPGGRPAATAGSLAPSVPPQGGSAMLRDAVLAKVLHGWLQNRHQTLFPLSVNLATLDPAQRATLAGMVAVSLLADGGHAGHDTPGHANTGHAAPGPAPAERETRARRWLAAAGADAATLDALDQALAAPPATSRLLDSVLAQGLAPYAYVAALVALDTRDAPGLHFLEYLAARLALPATLVRSANRRHRR